MAAQVGDIWERQLEAAFQSRQLAEKSVQALESQAQAQETARTQHDAHERWRNALGTKSSSISDLRRAYDECHAHHSKIVGRLSQEKVKLAEAKMELAEVKLKKNPEDDLLREAYNIAGIFTCFFFRLS